MLQQIHSVDPQGPAHCTTEAGVSRLPLSKPDSGTSIAAAVVSTVARTESGAVSLHKAKPHPEVFVAGAEGSIWRTSQVRVLPWNTRREEEEDAPEFMLRDARE